MMDSLPYSLDLLVHEGAETDLYRGRRAKDGLPVAVKTLRNEYPTWREASRLKREYGILKGLDLKGVPRAIEMVSHHGKLLLVMEDLGPMSLADIIRKRGRLDARDTLRLAIPLARTLAGLHDRHIVHKDVKPSNVVVDESTWAPHLVDFGISARIIEDAEGAVARGVFEGTPAYMAPEQTGQINRSVDRRADLYSMGATLYEMLTGAPPFDVMSQRDAIHAHLTQAPVDPRERVGDIPEMLSPIVLKLLEKSPENRYRSARGLVADLEACAAQIEAHGTIAPFLLGRNDAFEEVVLPDRIVGRDEEIRTLFDALARATKEGDVAIALVTGPSGIGKSALVREVLAKAATTGATIAAGKFDAMIRSVPYAALGQAMQALVRQVLGLPPGALEEKKAAIEAAVGAAGKLLTDVCPDLEFLIGEQPEPPALGPNEAKNRFALIVRRFLSVFAREGAPLVLFLDDLQWADPASLDLLVRLLSSGEMRHMLAIASYRSDEVYAGHLVSTALDSMRKAGVKPIEMVVGPLSADMTRRVVAAALSIEPEEVEELALSCWEKTQGNPFFLGQFLQTLAREGIVRFDTGVRRFVWDVERVRKAPATENVVALVASKIERVGAAARRALTYAACLGPSFDLAKLSVLVDAPAGRVAADLWEAVREGLLIPQGSDYRLLEEGAAAPEGKFDVWYRFLHDRIREGCLALVSAEERSAMHLAIGRMLLQAHFPLSAASYAGETGLGGEAQIPDDELLEITSHFSLGASGITDPDERLVVARLHLRAGRKAMKATAHASASKAFASGRALLGKDGFVRAYETCLGSWLDGAEADALVGEVERAETLLAEALEQAKTPMEEANVHLVRTRVYVWLGRFSDAVKTGLDGLGALSVKLPDEPAEQQRAFGVLLGKIGQLCEGRSIETLADAPMLADPRERLVLTFLSELCVPMYMVNPGFYPLIVAEQVHRTLVHGLSEFSAFAFATFGFIQGGVLGQYAAGHGLGRLGVALAERFGNPQIVARVRVMFTQMVYMREQLVNVRAHALRAQEAAIESGDLIYLGLAAYVVPLLFSTGMPLGELRSESQGYLGPAIRGNDLSVITSVRLCVQSIACLAGETNGRTDLDGPDMDMAAELGRLDPKQHAVAFAYYHWLRLFLHLLYGEHDAAIGAAADFERGSMALMGNYMPLYVPFLAALAHGGAARTMEAGEARAAHLSAIEAARARLAPLAEVCPSNFRHKVLLLDAELAALSGSVWEAVELYDRASQLARENAFVHEEAMANERCARLLLAKGSSRAARGYLMAAYQSYLGWGATAKAEALAEELPEAVAKGTRTTRTKKSTRGRGTKSVVETTAGTTLLTNMGANSLRDAVLVVRAIQAIASEMVPSRIVLRLMQIVLENSGAERGHFLLEREGKLWLEASFQASSASMEVERKRPFEEEEEIAQQAVLYAFRTSEVLVLDDAALDERFRSDPYIARKKPRSILCLPVSNQGRDVGILYLDNMQVAGAFTMVRVELLGLLASQAAIAIENATLLERVQAASEETKRTNERLEEEVAARTRELSQSNTELSMANDRLARELEDRARAEAERLALREQVVEAQKARLAELWAPVLPVSSDVLVMPIIGSMDEARTAQVTASALANTTQIGARIFILDITGMRQVDAASVGGLVSVALALKLVGAVPILTGVRPEVARAMVEIGAELSGIKTLATLRAGIAYAFGGKGPR